MIPKCSGMERFHHSIDVCIQHAQREGRNHKAISAILTATIGITNCGCLNLAVTHQI